MNNHQLNIFSTSHCHLCSHAEQILKDLGHTSIKVIEISGNEDLLKSYGLRIPVLQREDNMAELNWPFNANEVISFLCN